MDFHSALEHMKEIAEIGEECELIADINVSDDYHILWRGYEYRTWREFWDAFRPVLQEFRAKKKAEEEEYSSEDAHYQGEIEYTDKNGVTRHSDICGTREVLMAMLPSYLMEIAKNADLTKPWKVDGGFFCKYHSEESFKDSVRK